ncbi:MAG: YHS domain-containing protein [Actinomycetota bacterium]
MATVRDPGCGMKVDPTTAAATVEFEGETYYFCSPACREQFRAQPDRYAPGG